MKKETISHIALIIANLIYGANYIISKDLMPNHITPRAIILIRITISLLFFFSAFYFFYKEKVEKKDLKIIAVSSIFGIGINQIMFFEGLNLTSTINSAIIMTINPIFVLVFSLFLLKEKLTLLKFSGIIIGTIGAIFLIITSGTHSKVSGNISGDTMILINAVSFAFYLSLIKPIMKKYSPVTISFWLFFFGFFISAPFCISEFSKTNFETFTTQTWLSISYIVFGATIAGYLLYNYALKYLSPTVTSSYIYSQPLIATIIAIIIGQDSIDFAKIISGLLIFAGVFLTSYQKKVN